MNSTLNPCPFCGGEARKLTLENLEKMNGEPIFIVYPSGTYASHWDLVYGMEYRGNTAFVLLSDKYTLSIDNLGTEWIAYDRKPPIRAQ